MTRRSFNALTTSLAASAGALAETAQIAAPSTSSVAPFSYSTHVYREPSLPLEQIRADLPVLKKLGFTMIKIQESWSADEMKEGEIDLHRVEQVVSDARQNQLLVYFGITMEQAPAWLWSKYPDCTMRYENNVPVLDPTQYLLPNDGKPGPCWNHPGARAAAVRFIEVLGRRIGRFDNILVWNVWQEIGFGFDANVSRVCFCPNTLAAFRTWLRGKFQSLQNLNRAWRTNYAIWDEVEPPRIFPKVPSMVDWRYFMNDVYLSDALQWKAKAFRDSDPYHRKILAHSASPHYGSAADWRLARAGLDIYGSSCYPGWGEFQEPGVTNQERLEKSAAPYLQALDNAIKWDYIRSASVKGEFWAAELQGGRASGGLTPGRVPDAGDIQRWVLGALAGGARGICFWNHRSEIFWDEAYGFGLLELEGNQTARADEAGRIARAIDNKAADLLRTGACPHAQVAIVVDEGMWNFVGACGDPLKSGFVSNLRGLHRATFEAGIPVDFLDAAGLERSGQTYKVLILPLPISLSRAVMSALTNYVANGGILIAGPFPGRFSEYGFASPGELPAEMQTLFGVQHKQILTLAARAAHPSQSTFKPEDAAKIQLTGTGDFAGFSVEPSLFLQYLSPTKATPILQLANEIVGSENRFGKGRAILLGSLLGTPVGEAGSPNGRFIEALLKRSGLDADRAGSLILRRREGNGQAALFLFNPSRSEVTETVPIGRFTRAEDLLDAQQFSVENAAVRVRVQPLAYCCVVLS